MRKTHIALSTLFLVFIVCPSLAQANDISVMAGAYTPSLRIGSQPSPISLSARASVQLGYAHQLRPMRNASLDLDVPLTITSHLNEASGLDMSVSSQTNVFFTPGIRFRIVPQSRVSPFVVTGAGVGSFGKAEVYAGSGFGVSVGRAASPVLGFGGGVDFRLTRLLSLRGEVRDFVSRAGMGGTEGRHHPVFVAGLGFHFN